MGRSRVVTKAEIEDENRRLRDRVAALEAGIDAAAIEVIEATGVDDHYLALQLRALLDGRVPSTGQETT